MLPSGVPAPAWRGSPRPAAGLRGAPCSAPGCVRAGLLAAALLAACLLWAPGGAAWAQAPPTYRLSAQVDLDAHTIAGTLELELPPGDPRLGSELWFHLPPNRFVEEDTRGRRRDTDSLPFSYRLLGEPVFDPIWPRGYSRGFITVHRIETADGQAVPHTLAPDPRMPVGYAQRDGLMRVELAAAPGARRLRIAFTTHLPQRYWEGWSDAGVLVEEWYPVLANRRGGAWELDPFAAHPGYFAATLTTTGSGQLFVGQGWAFAMEPGVPAEVPLGDHPLRALPLVFMHAQPAVVKHDYDLSLYSYFAPGHERLGHQAVRIADAFRHFVRDKYRLPPPATRIAIVEVDVPPGDIRTVAGLVLVPRSYYQNSPLLDRVYLAQLSRAVAQVWFGEAVWSNRDTQTWLHLGLSGYLALDYFHSLYGWDAGIHDLMDWLQPKYREHFFEAPVRQLIRTQRDAPLGISLHEYPLQRTARLVTHNKAPLVLRSLYYVVGRDAFAQGLNALYFRHRHQEVTQETFQQELSGISGTDLEPFFRLWFRDTPDVDFAVERWEQEQTPQGYQLRVWVRRTPQPLLPVTVRVVSTSGQAQEQRWVGSGTQAELHFLLDQPAASVVIDPEEYWLELDRKDNRSDVLYRVRPIFDWSKQREILITFHGLLGGNTTDGNIFGAGVRLSFNENNELSVLPIYGERSGLTNYQVRWHYEQFLHPRLNLNLTLERLGGTTLQSAGLEYTLLSTDAHQLDSMLEVRAEALADQAFVDRDGAIVSQPAGRANNVHLEIEYRHNPGRYLSHLARLDLQNSRPWYGGTYSFTAYRADIAQTIAFRSSHVLLAQITRAGTEGSPPLQMRHEMGGPELLRGYPRLVSLAAEELVAARLDYGIVATRHILGSGVQVRQATVFLFGDVGRGWNGGEHFDTRPQRQDLGLGLELQISLFRLLDFPIRVDLAYPVNDDEFRSPQFILLGLLNF